MKQHTQKILSLMLVVAMLFAMCAQAFAAGATPAQLYVKAGEGSDTNAGTTEAAPLLTLGKALELSGTGTEIVILNDIPLSKPLEIRSKTVTIASKDGNSAIYYDSTGETVGADSGIIQVTDGANVTLRDVTVKGTNGKQGSIVGRCLYVGEGVVTLNNATLRDGCISVGPWDAGGAGAYVAAKGTLNVSGSTIQGSTTDGQGGGVYVAKGGNLNISNGSTISGNKAAYGGGIYFATQEGEADGVAAHIEASTFTSNTATENGGAMYVEKDARVTVSGVVSANGHKVSKKNNNIYLATDATLDISGYTGGSALGITAEDEYAYRLISNPVAYTIKTEPLDEADEAYWKDDCGAWDIRYLNHGGVPGLYLVYHTLDAVFEDVDTLAAVEGSDPNGVIVDYKTAELPDTTNVDGVLTVPSVVLQSNEQSAIDGDYVVTIRCDENHRVPTEDIVAVTSGGKDVPFTYVPDFDGGVATITIKREDVDKLTDTIHFTVTADKYHLLTIEADGPLYAMSTTITGQEMLCLGMTGGKAGTNASYTITRNERGVANISVTLYKEGTSEVAATAVTDTNGVATFTDLEADVAYYPVLSYSDSFKVIEREKVNVTLSTLDGQTLNGGNIVEGTADINYTPTATETGITGATAEISNVLSDAKAKFTIVQGSTNVTFHGNEGEATTAPATISLRGDEQQGELIKAMEKSATTVGELAHAELTGYTFGGWYDNAACEGEAVNADTPYVSDLYAKWTANDDTEFHVEHWVELAPAGSGTNCNTSGTEEDGYYLYKLDDHGSTQTSHQSTSDSIMDISDLDLKVMSVADAAWWTRDGFTAHVKLGTYETQADGSQVFVENIGENCKVLANGKSVFRIYYDRNEYNVNFSVPEDCEPNEIPSQTVKFGCTYGSLPGDGTDASFKVVRPGYNYCIWYADGGTRMVTRSTTHTLTSDIDLTSDWRNANPDTKYAIKIAVRDIQTNEAGEKVPCDTFSEVKTITRNDAGEYLMGVTDVTYTTAIADMQSLTVPGFHMVGYADAYDTKGANMTADTDSFSFTIKPTDALAEKTDGEFNEAFDGTVVWLYYDRDTVKVEFVPDPGKDPIDEDDLVFGGDFTGHLPPAPGKDGYDFDGWEDPDGNPVTDDTPADDYVKDGDTVVVTATWTPRKYLLTYVPGDKAEFVSAATSGRVEKSTTVAGGYIEPTEKTYDEPFGTLPTATRPGYNFIGWATTGEKTVNKHGVDVTAAKFIVDKLGRALSEVWEVIDANLSAPVNTLTTQNVVISNRPVYDAEDTRPLHSVFKPHVYTLVFHPQATKTGIKGTVSPKTLDVTFDSAIEGLPVPSLKGYRFVEWRVRENDPATKIQDGDIWTYAYSADGAEIPVYAIYVPETYRYDFDLNDEVGSTKGTMIDTSIEYTEETYDELYAGVTSVVATRPGYDFVGWSLTRDGDILTKEAMVDIAEDTTVYAIWRAKKYPVKMEMKGGTIVDLTDNTNLDTYDPTAVYDAETDTWTVTVAFDTAYGTLPVPEKELCEYRGYLVKAPGWPEIDGKVITELPQYIDYLDEAGIVLTAVLEPYFTFDPDGSHFVEDGSEDPKTILQSEIKELPEVEKDGYYPVGWTDTTGEVVDLDDILAKTEPETLKPKFVPIVTLDANGGQVDGKEVAELPLLDEVTGLPVPTREDYVFNGWFTEKDGGEPVDIAKMKENGIPVTVYAQWTATVTLNANGGKLDDDKEIQKLPLTSDVAALPTPTRPGYTFQGWFTEKDDGKKVDLETLKVNNVPVEVFAHWSRNSTGGGGGGSRPSTSLTITFETNGGSKIAPQSVSYNATATKPVDPIKQGYTFVGWYTDKELKDEFDFTTKVRKSMTLYAKWLYTGPFTYLTDEHIAYIIGKDDGLVHPEANITRAEVAMIFYRLLKPEVRQVYKTTSNDFVDVPKDAWYQTAVSTLAKMGMVKGRGEGIFDPNANITRAEFAVIASRFDTVSVGTKTFPDVPATYWAYKEIGSAAAKGWVEGRGDGTFGPNLDITRAEVVTLVNRVLERASITVESIGKTTEPMITWKDNMDTHAWFYLPIQEATNAHTHESKGNVEHWKAVLPVTVAAK